MTIKKHSWERWENEGEEAYAMFRIYMDMGVKRTIIGVGRELEKMKGRKGAGKAKESSGYIQRTAKKYDWIDRARAYDDHLYRAGLAAHEEIVAEAARQHALDIVEIRDYAMTLIKEQLKKKGQKISLGELASLLDKIDKTARLTFGDATERVSGVIEDANTDDIIEAIERKINQAIAKPAGAGKKKGISKSD